MPQLELIEAIEKELWKSADTLVQTQILLVMNISFQLWGSYFFVMHTADILR